ncbi:unnamed protein product [Allacma fusca]|uniref:Uncharacterized protein n=1 Tax=Allacma fusca TaxID=39272 RepID=A0A8J2NRK8_9HEXA|nr:unnamed protein product [Allacma fusca]
MDGINGTSGSEVFIATNVFNGEIQGGVAKDIAVSNGEKHYSAYGATTGEQLRKKLFLYDYPDIIIFLNS